MKNQNGWEFPRAELVKDALELGLGMKKPYDLLRQVRSGTPAGHVDRSEQTGIGLKVKLRAKRAD